MSAVINVVTPFFVSLVADARRNGTLKDGSSVVLSENTHKIFRLSPLVAVGFTGVYEYAIQVLNSLNEIVGFNPLISSDDLAERAQSVTQLLLGPGNLQFVVTGRNSSGVMAAYTYRRDSDISIEEHLISSDEPCKYQILCDTDLKHIFQRALTSVINANPPNLPLSIAECCSQHIKLISEINSTVNNRTEQIILAL